MILKSKKTGLESVVSITEYDRMKEIGINSNFIIIDKGDSPEPESDTSPKIIEFIKKNPAEVVVEEEKKRKSKKSK